MIIICGSSAWQYWRTPPVLRDGWLDESVLDAALPKESPDRAALRTLRRNAREADRAVHARLLGELKGVSLPVHVMVDAPYDRHPTTLVVPHRMAQGLPARAIRPLGGGLFVLSPEASALSLGRAETLPTRIISVAKRAFEACGIFSIMPSNGRVDVALRELVERGALSPGASGRHGIAAFSDARGRRLPSCDRHGEPLPWMPSFDRLGKITDLWKRPPLTSVSEMASLLDEAGAGQGVEGAETARRALETVMEGAASPEEVRAVMLLCSPTWLGGESWGRPDLNRTVLLTSSAKAIAHQARCVADVLWARQKVDLEVQGKAFHADEQGFNVATGRRPALESMGYAVLELTHEQMANLELLDAMLPTFARALGMPLRSRTPAFLKRRAALHRALFDGPYDPV